MIKARRGYGEGSVFQDKLGRWCATLETGLAFDGRRRRRVFRAKTKTDAIKKRDEFKLQITAGTPVEVSRVSVAQYLDTWLKSKGEARLKPTTKDLWTWQIEKYIKPYIGGMKLKSVRPENIETLYAELKRAGKSNDACQKVHTILRRILPDAAKAGLMAPLAWERIDKPKSMKKEMLFWSGEESRRFLEHAEGDRFFPLYATALATGMRQGELFALRWDDIDLKQHMVSVRRTVSMIKGKFVVGEPKTKKSRRAITIPANLAALLRKHREKMLASGFIAKPVFCTAEGGYLNRNNVTQRSFDVIVEAAKIKRIRFHDMRHTHATQLLILGVHPKVVQERLGHSTIALTLDTYSHVIPTMQEDAASRGDALLAGLNSGKWLQHGYNPAPASE